MMRKQKRVINSNQRALHGASVTWTRRRTESICEIWQWKLEERYRNCQRFWSRTKDMHYRNVETYVAMEDTWKVRFPHLPVCSEIPIWSRRHFTRWSEHWSVHGDSRNLIVAKQVNKSRKTIVKPARYLDCVSWNVLKHFRGGFFALRSIIWSGYVQADIIIKVNWRFVWILFTD